MGLVRKLCVLALAILVRAQEPACADPAVSPNAEHVMYNQSSHIVSALCSSAAFGTKVDDSCCTEVGAELPVMVGRTFAQIYQAGGQSVCPVLLPAFGMHANMQCNADGTITYGEACTPDCQPCNSTMVMSAGCYRATDLPGTNWFVKSAGCACPTATAATAPTPPACNTFATSATCPSGRCGWIFDLCKETPTPAPPVLECQVVTEENNPDCYGNVTWAMTTGKVEHPAWYYDYPVLMHNQSFEAFQAVLAAKVGEGNGIRRGTGWSCPPPCDFDVPDCADVTSQSPGECFTNVLWAKDTGIKTQPEFYKEWPQLTADSPLADFQYILHIKATTPGMGKGWECPKPCSSDLTPPPTSPPTSPPTPLPTLGTPKEIFAPPPTFTTSSTTTWTTSTTTTEESGSSWPWWAWLLLAGLGLLFCCVLPGVLYMYFNKKDTPQKKTRARPPKKQDDGSSRILQPVVQQTAQSVPMTMAQPAPQYTVPTQQAVPTYDTRAVAPMQMAPPLVPQPQLAAAQPMTYPSFQMAAPAGYAPQPMMQPMAAPVQDPRAQALALFDSMDLNRDGVITREEFNRMMNPGR